MGGGLRLQRGGFWQFTTLWTDVSRADLRTFAEATSTGASGPKPTFVQVAANDRNEPKVSDAAQLLNVWF